jgi:serine/threonine-protein kinase
VVVGVNRGQGGDLWISDISFQRLTPLPFSTGVFFAWSHDSRYLFFSIFRSRASDSASDSPGLVRRAADGTGAEVRLTSTRSQQRVITISPDGKYLVFEEQTPAFSYDLMVLSLDDPAISTGAGARTSPLLDTPADERNASIAPDGRWMAYESNKSGRFEIYVRPFPNVNDAEHPVSTDGGRTPLWSPTGSELFFVSGSALMAVPVQTTPAFSAGNPTRLFEAQSRILDGRLLGNTGRTFDVSRDGRRFLMTKGTTGAADGDGTPPGIIVVQNWFEELRARVPVAR